MTDPIARAVSALAAGNVVSAASESSFGLLADAMSLPAVERVFELKGRLPTAPVPVLIPSIEAVRELATEVPDLAWELMRRYWPGPLTIVLKAQPFVPALVCGGTGKIGVRVPGECPAAEIVRRFGRPVTATSANRAAESPWVSSQDVEASFGGKIAFVVPGQAPGGLPSTVLDATVCPPRLVRAGRIFVSIPTLGGT